MPRRSVQYVVMTLIAGLLALPALEPLAAAPRDNAIILWNQDALQGVRDAGGQNGPGKLGPPMIARALAMVNTCAYDAWAAYDPIAAGTMFGDALRRPALEQTEANKQQAVSFAAYRALVDVFPIDIQLFTSTMTSLGYDPANTTTDVTTPAGVGNVACAAVLAYRHHDGSNQLGDLHPGSYSDYTGYKPVNLPMDTRAPFDPATVIDPNRWQPLTFVNSSGHVATQAEVGPFWNRVKPFALQSDSQFRSSTGPAKYGSLQYLNQALELIEISATLNDREKVIAEYWADGPNSEQPPGHWNLFAQAISHRDNHTIDQDAKLFFALSNAIFDAGIVAWDNKDTFDSVRPITAIRYLFHGVKILAWGGPGLGTQLIDGGDWTPYQASTFPTPPFAEYSSGHSNFSAAGAEILKFFTGSDAFGGSVTIPAGSSKFERGVTPSQDVTLSWPTFSDAANEAGMSRRYGGIHFTQGDLDARKTGRLAADQTWAKAQLLFEGQPQPL